MVRPYDDSVPIPLQERPEGCSMIECLALANVDILEDAITN